MAKMGEIFKKIPYQNFGFLSLYWIFVTMLLQYIQYETWENLYFLLDEMYRIFIWAPSN